MAAEPDANLHIRYEGRWAGARALTLDVQLSQTATGYTVRTTLRTVGALRALVRGRTEEVAQGTWQGVGAVPLHVDSEGVWNGQVRRLVMDYADAAPHVSVLEPTEHEPRQPLTPADTRGTVDGWALMAGLIHQVAATGRCDRIARVFDGRGVAEIIVRTAPASPSVLRCDFSTRPIAGLRLHADPPRTEHGFAEFAAPHPGLPSVPVRIVFATRWAGDAVLTLIDAAPS